MTKVLLRICFWATLAAPLMALAVDYPTRFSNQDSVANTRHNMTQSTTGGYDSNMNSVRNNYGAVCVYCHTPHGANTGTAAPLWNRTMGNASYTLYSSSTLNGVINGPGASSLPCLSCHDGTQAADAILNMPGSGGYATTPNPRNFVPMLAAGQTKAALHMGLAYRMDPNGDEFTGTEAGCLFCHSGPSGLQWGPDFTAFLIGTDLRNDHPVGVAFPATNGAGTDWKTPSGTKVSGGATITYFDEPGAGSGHLDKGDIRLFGAGSDARVECASCHDPHGVPSGAAGSTFLPTFLRKPIDASGVCLTCHAK